MLYGCAILPPWCFSYTTTTTATRPVASDKTLAIYSTLFWFCLQVRFLVLCQVGQLKFCWEWTWGQLYEYDYDPNKISLTVSCVSSLLFVKPQAAPMASCDPDLYVMTWLRSHRAVHNNRKRVTSLPLHEQKAHLPWGDLSAWSTFEGLHFEKQVRRKSVSYFGLWLYTSLPESVNEGMSLFVFKLRLRSNCSSVGSIITIMLSDSSMLKM